MLSITNKQLQEMEAVTTEQNISNLIKVLQKDYADTYTTKPANEWPNYVKQKMALAKSWEIIEFENQFLIVLATLEYPQHFSGEIPYWMAELMEWPDRDENEKTVLLFKELIKRTDTSTNEN